MRRFKETLSLFSLLLHPDRSRPDKVYDFLSTHNNLAEESLYLNLGYWQDATTYDGACEALAILLGETAGLCSEDVVLDAGCGFADQDMCWARHFHPRKIIAINITPMQVEVAGRRVRDAGLADVIELQVASATKIPLPDASVTKVVALESAFHFNTREDFFREAWRVLRPGGRLALADIGSRFVKGNRGQFLSDTVGKILWQIPDANMYSGDIFKQKLESMGYINCRVDSIRDHVFAPFRQFAQKRIADQEVVERLNPLLKMLWSADHNDGGDQSQTMDYLLVTADKS